MPGRRSTDRAWNAGVPRGKTEAARANGATQRKRNAISRVRRDDDPCRSSGQCGRAKSDSGAGIGDRQVRNVGTIGGSLAGNWSAAAIARVKVPASGLSSDLHGSAEYRAHLVGVLAQRAVTSAQ
jgi:hypothetical protein